MSITLVLFIYLTLKSIISSVLFIMAVRKYNQMLKVRDEARKYYETAESVFADIHSYFEEEGIVQEPRKEAA